MNTQYSLKPFLNFEQSISTSIYFPVFLNFKDSNILTKTYQALNQVHQTIINSFLFLSKIYTRAASIKTEICRPIYMLISTLSARLYKYIENQKSILFEIQYFINIKTPMEPHIKCDSDGV